MRITSGILKNRKIKSFDVDIRPTKESVREAIFSSIGGTCKNLHILDLYAGYGSFGLEAWSRGARRVTFVENHKFLTNQLSQFIKDIKDENEHIISNSKEKTEEMIGKTLDAIETGFSNLSDTLNKKTTKS